ncbi:MAG: hypothetical protein AAFX78_18505, partial [Cyanobacteria bacterium J06638_20]
MTDKAVRAPVQIGGGDMEGYQMPDGSYRMSQASAADAIGDSPVYALRFLQSKDSKALLGEHYTDYTPEQIEVEPTPGKRGQSRINALPLEVVSAYWLYRAHRGNKKAFALCFALMSETLDRRFDSAFGVSRTDEEYNQRLANRIEQLQNSLDELGEAYAEPEVLREYIARLEAQVRRLGEEPLQNPHQQSEG